ncbi:hypothetical protein P153DRAFT_335474 [Dothidotthia symphoricarpi CBS 119687]|uniref:RNA polymerase II assembly factor Rtp1 C-terminal domain-containing protein n=1 Tax=Dothidotthia symphoricarpi CBS 119687 TaxID=1392245 RepID=A0A6A6AH58_9PLEO|nr:uncharacterized protein P153DRAFT_335474 [Dothidotthia symphoricarpi CBS 119687]KAF2131279.1 hypothetical protein P153DRAFT_335474 [Dothidotthia symphoricarpi CBS 119687]
MGAIEDAVDAAANFVGPFVDRARKENEYQNGRTELNSEDLVEQALSHLQAINAADLTADPNAPYDASLAGVVYALLDLITSLGILPYVSPGLAFSQRPKSVLTISIIPCPNRTEDTLVKVIQILLVILEQRGSGVQPLISQRIFPDVVSALVELSMSPEKSLETRSTFEPFYNNTISETPTSRLLLILTTFLQQPLPSWTKPRLSKELAMVPLRNKGVRHTIEFLSLSYLNKNSHVPQQAAGPSSQIPIPLEAITQASRLLVSPPSGIAQDDWLRGLEPQLWNLLDGDEGKELSRAAGQIIAGGILSKKTTGAPGTIGWDLFARPILEAIYPRKALTTTTRQSTNDQIVMPEESLKLALERLYAIASSYSHAGLLKRLVGPLLLPLWALFNYAKARPSLNQEWSRLPRSILLRYMAIACDPKQTNAIAMNLFWEGDASWIFGPGSQGGVEIRVRSIKSDGTDALQDMDSILSRVSNLDERVDRLVSLLSEADVADDMAGTIFVQAAKRWLSPTKDNTQSLTDDPDDDPLAALTNAKLSEAMATKFKDKFVKSPQHIVELMGQLLQNYTTEHRSRTAKLAKSKAPRRANLDKIFQKDGLDREIDDGTADEELISFALSIMKTLLTSPEFKPTAATDALLPDLLEELRYLSQQHPQLPISPLLTNSASTLVHLLAPTVPSTSSPITDPLTEHRATLKTISTELTSAEPPNRTWALHTLHKLIQNTSAFPAIDIPSIAHLLLSASIADPESYVHTAAIPVLVDLAVRAPKPTVRIIVDAFIDIDEQSLKLTRGKPTDEKERKLQEALDFRLRVGEVLHNFILEDAFWTHCNDTTPLRQIVEATLSLASRRGQRKQTLSTRSLLFADEERLREEGEAAWGGPLPDLLSPDASSAPDPDVDALLKLVQGWQETGLEEDIRLRTSALSILGTIFEHRLPLLSQAVVDAGLQTVLYVLTLENATSKAILRRAAVLVVMGLLRALDAALEHGRESGVGLGVRQRGEVERVVRWVGDEDGDALVRDHAGSVVEGLETLEMKRLYRVRDEGLRLGLGPDLGLEGRLKGLDVELDVSGSSAARKRMVVEEIE